VLATDGDDEELATIGATLPMLVGEDTLDEVEDVCVIEVDGVLTGIDVKRDSKKL
jgi:hypothetical protein